MAPTTATLLQRARLVGRRLGEQQACGQRGAEQAAERFDGDEQVGRRRAANGGADGPARCYDSFMNPIVLAMVAAAAMPTAGTKAPAFSLESTSGKKVGLDDYKGKTLVLAFFPKAFSGG